MAELLKNRHILHYQASKIWELTVYIHMVTEG